MVEAKLPENYNPFYDGSIIISNLDKLVLKIKKGYFNCLLVFGPTRSGKTTVASQCGAYIASRVGAEFNTESIFFDASRLEEECKKGKKNAVYMLDEAAFDLTGEDWAKEAQKRLKTYFSVAAKYNQTIILLIPHIEELRKYFVINEHTRGIEVRINKKTLDRGGLILYSQNALRYLYYFRKMNQYSRADGVMGFRCSFRKGLPPTIDEAEYEKRKDEAIQLGNEKDESNTKANFIKRGVKLGIDPKLIASMLNIQVNYVYTIRGQLKREEPLGDTK